MVCRTRTWLNKTTMNNTTKMKRNNIRLFGTVALSTLAVCGSAWGAVLFHDDFNGAPDPTWSILHPDTDYYSVAATELCLRVPSGSFYAGYTDYTNLFLIDNPTTGDFVVTLKVNSFAPVGPQEQPQIAIVAYDDDDNHVRSSYGRIDGWLTLEFATESGGSFWPRRQEQDFGSSPFWLQLRKTNTTYTQFYSADGLTFVQANAPATYGDGTPQKLGFLGMAGSGSGTNLACVDSFTVTGTLEPSLSVRASEVEVCWTSETNATYRVEYRSDLTTNTWVTLQECVLGTSAETCIYDTILRGQPQRFYRVVVTNCVRGL